MPNDIYDMIWSIGGWGWVYIAHSKAFSLTHSPLLLPPLLLLLLLPMVLIKDGNTEIGARNNPFYVVCLRHFISSRAVTNRIFFSPKRPIYIYMFATSFELPSDISGMYQTPWINNKVTLNSSFNMHMNFRDSIVFVLIQLNNRWRSLVLHGHSEI